MYQEIHVISEFIQLLYSSIVLCTNLYSVEQNEVSSSILVYTTSLQGSGVLASNNRYFLVVFTSSYPSVSLFEIMLQFLFDLHRNLDIAPFIDFLLRVVLTPFIYYFVRSADTPVIEEFYCRCEKEIMK